MSGAGLQCNGNWVKSRKNNGFKSSGRGHESDEKIVGESGIKLESDCLTSNVVGFLRLIAPSVHAHFLSKTTMRGWRTCDVEFKPYFMLSDLWDSYKEWSVYGAGVPLMLNGNESVIQYYVPYLSGIQIYADSEKSRDKSRPASDDHDGDYFSKDSSSGGSSDSEHDSGLMYSMRQRNRCIHPSDVSLKMEKLFLKDQHIEAQEGFLSDEGEFGRNHGCLLFEYLEQDPPYCREPMACKISDLASQFPELMTLRSCDLLSSSWLSVAWYPIYRIPTGTTLKDLDACFLTYHSLHSPAGEVADAHGPVMIYPDESDGVPRITLPAFGLSAYKFKGSLWTSDSGSDNQLVTSLSRAAGNWLKLLHVNHPDYLFFSRNR